MAGRSIAVPAVPALCPYAGRREEDPFGGVLAPPVAWPWSIATWLPINVIRLHRFSDNQAEPEAHLPLPLEVGARTPHACQPALLVREHRTDHAQAGPGRQPGRRDTNAVARPAGAVRQLGLTCDERLLMGRVAFPDAFPQQATRSSISFSAGIPKAHRSNMAPAAAASVGTSIARTARSKLTSSSSLSQQDA